MSLLSGAMTGDIWSTGAFSFESPLKDLLDSDDFTLEQLLAEDELLQELRGVHPKLIAYFSTEQAVTKLVQYLILPPDDAAATVAAAALDVPVPVPVVEEATVTAEVVVPESNGSSQVTPIDSTETTTTAAETTTADDTSSPASEPEQLSAPPRQPGEWLLQQIQKTESSASASVSLSPEKSKTPERDPELLHIRFPFMACEIICCEINGILSTLVDGHVVVSNNNNNNNNSEQPQQLLLQEIFPSGTNDSADRVEVVTTTTTTADHPDPAAQQQRPQPQLRILDLLFGVLYATEPGKLDDYRAGYFDKILSILFRKRPTEMSLYINQGGSRGRSDMMRAILNHLYSHSIMQIAQRLLLPQRPVEKGADDDQDDDQDEDDDDDDHLLTDALDNGEDDPTFECDWPGSPDALDMLLEILMGTDESVALAGDDSESAVEHRLNLSQNASEVLITIIQHSLLSSKTILTLTSSENVGKIVTAATTLRGDDEYFSPHESLLTSAMNVLESMILQLGGYGAVGTMAMLLDDEDNAEEEQPADNEATGDENKEANEENVEIENEEPAIADLSTLIEHLPRLLENLATLLRHPSTEEWKSPMQFARSEPQQLLGTSRLRIVRVLEAMVLLGDFDVDAHLVESDCLELCLDLFWQFQWCSMLHQSVANLLVHVFEGGNARVEMQEYFIIRCNLLKRLVDSYSEMQVGPSIPAVVMGLKELNVESEAPSSVGSDKGSTDRLPVSEDDIDAALEKEESEAKGQDVSPEKAREAETISVDQGSTEAVQFESRDASTIGLGPGAPSQSFRLGYMGHVIIICQALVHASSEDLDESQEENETADGDEAPPPKTEDQSVEQGDSLAEDEEKEPLFLAEMIKYHPMQDRWQEFMSTTLATETSVQATPLGGFNTSSNDPLHSHRPGLAEGDIMGDDGATPPLPPRGMLGGGDVIDMDDNDLDIAASMMAGLALRQNSGGDSDDDNSGDSQKTYDSGETANSGGYLFDDPLGKMKDGGLGIELGKLMQVKGLAAKAGVGGNDDDDEDSHSSSDEEPEAQRSSSDEEEPDVPVMDLFAGNFSYGDSSAESSDSPVPDWSNFANFDSAFDAGQAAAAADDEFGDFASAESPATADSSEGSTSAAEIEEIFGHGDHASLLEAEDSVDDLAAAFAPFVPPTEEESEPIESAEIEGDSAPVRPEAEADVDDRPAKTSEGALAATVVEVTEEPVSVDTEKSDDVNKPTDDGKKETVPVETTDASPTPENDEPARD